MELFLIIILKCQTLKKPPFNVLHYFLVLAIAILQFLLILFLNVKIHFSGSGKCDLYSRELVLVSAGRGRGGARASDVKHVIVTNRRPMDRSYRNVILASHYNLQFYASKYTF